MWGVVNADALTTPHSIYSQPTSGLGNSKVLPACNAGYRHGSTENPPAYCSARTNHILANQSCIRAAEFVEGGSLRSPPRKKPATNHKKITIFSNYIKTYHKRITILQVWLLEIVYYVTSHLVKTPVLTLYVAKFSLSFPLAFFLFYCYNKINTFMKQRLSTYLNENELKVLLRLPDQRTLIGKRDYVILKLMLLTGLRRDEMCNLKSGNFQVDGKRFWLYVIGKGDKERKLPIMDTDLVDSILVYWNRAGISPHTNQPFFKTHGHGNRRSGQPITWRVIQTVINKYCEMAQIPRKITPHSFRHTYLTRLIQKGADIATAQKLAGHSSITTTQRYIHTDEARMRRAVELLKIGA